MSAERNRASNRTHHRPHTASDTLNGLAALAARGAAVVFALALAYTLYAVFGGGLKAYPTGYTPALAERLGQNVHLAAAALVWSAAALALCAVILWWGWEMAALLFLLAGALFYVGLPYLGVPAISAYAMAAQPAPRPGYAIVQAWRTVGMVGFGAGALFLVGWAWDRLQTSLASARRTQGGLRLPFYSACWQTQYCKTDINRFCAPGRKGFRKSCWRHKSGCFCDASIGDRVLETARREAGPGAAKWFGTRAAAPAPTLADRFRSTHHRVAGQTIACADCPIYNYHEVQKHRILAPLVVVAIPALMYYHGDALRANYRAMVAALDRFALHLSFSPDSTAALSRQIHGAFGEPVVEYLVYALTGMLLITFAARLLEMWCFEWKL